MSTGTFSSSFRLGSLEGHLDAGALLLTPNQRLARVIKVAWDRRQAGRGLRVWRPAAVKPLEFWLHELWQAAVAQGTCPPLVCLTTLQARELWLRVIALDCERQGNYSLLLSGGAADLAANARESLLQAGLDYRKPGLQAEFRLDIDCATFLRWLQAFDSELEKAGAATASDCLVALRQADGIAPLSGVVLVDTESVTALQQACLDRVAASLSNAVSGDQAAQTDCHSFPDRPAELSAVAAWAAASNRASPQQRLGIILRDMHGDRARLEYELRHAFGCLGENYTALPVNFSTALRLDQVPVVRDALRMLACCQREMPLADVTALLRSRFCLPVFALDPAIADLVEKLFADGREKVEISRLRFHARGKGHEESGEPAPVAALGGILTALQTLRLHASRQLPSAWVGPFSAVLQLWQWPGPDALDSLEYQQVESWYRVLDDFSGMDGVSGELNLDEALALLQRCCKARTAQPKTADSPVQVLGPLEAAGLQFDQVWLCGLEGSQWPEPPRPNPFVPLRLQRQHGMPHASSEQQWAYADTLWRQYRAGCARLHASYARQLDNAPQLPSPFLQPHGIEAREGNLRLPARWLSAQETADLASVPDDRAPALPASQQLLSGGSGLLRDQAACPFRAYARQRLRVEKLADPVAGLSAQERGNLLHASLQALWTALGDSQQLALLDEAQRAQVIAGAVQGAIDSVPESLRILVGLHCLALESRRLQSLLEEWLVLEQGRGDFVVEANEAPCKFTLGGKQLTLRVDRVDRLADGGRVIIDYKSGVCRVKDWSGERPAQPQLPLYSIATNAAAIAFAQVRTRDCKLMGIGERGGVTGINDDLASALANDNPQLEWAELNAQWRNNLEKLMNEFIAGEARVDPQPRACDYCGLQALCRVESTNGVEEGVEE